jgi:hypothetical protein
MIKCALACLCTLSLSAGAVLASDEVELSALEGAAYTDASQGVVQVLCQSGVDGAYFLSRAIVLDLGTTGRPYEVLLTAGHAVMDSAGDRDCHVRGQDEDVGRVIAIVSSNAPEHVVSDFNNDWAVLRTGDRFDADFPRVRPAVLARGDQGQLSLLVKAVEQEACQITAAPAQMEDKRLIFHDCASRPGLSGSPMMTVVDGQSYVVGIHLGRLTMLNENSRSYSVARRLSDDFLEALLAVLEDDQQP